MRTLLSNTPPPCKHAGHQKRCKKNKAPILLGLLVYESGHIQRMKDALPGMRNAGCEAVLLDLCRNVPRNKHVSFWVIYGDQNITRLCSTLHICNVSDHVSLQEVSSLTATISNCKSESATCLHSVLPQSDRCFESGDI